MIKGVNNLKIIFWDYTIIRNVWKVEISVLDPGKIIINEGENVVKVEDIKSIIK